MKANEQTLEKIGRALRKTAAHLTENKEEKPLTDIHIRVKQEGAELSVHDDKGTELHRCVIDEWIDNTEENFYEDLQPILRRVIKANKDVVNNMNVLKPFSIVLAGETGETITELYLVDDDLAILDGELMSGLSEELDDFLKELFDK